MNVKLNIPVHIKPPEEPSIAALYLACEWLATVSSKDGSGHGDLARAALIRAGHTEIEAWDCTNHWQGKTRNRSEGRHARLRQIHGTSNN